MLEGWSVAKLPLREAAKIEGQIASAGAQESVKTMHTLPFIRLP